jgi:L-lactate dehydrogenase complex protein LldG
MSDREIIFARVRAGLERRHTPTAPDAPPAWLPPRPSGDLIARFHQQATRLASSVIGPLAPAAVPAAIAGYLARERLPLQAACWPELGGQDWSAAGLSVEPRPATATDLVGITGTFCAIAETGTLMLLSGPQTPASVSLLPETHVAIVPVTSVVATMEDGWARLRAEHGQLPRAVNFVSGPSRTADIEQTVTLGAHGPYRVLIVLTTD